VSGGTRFDPARKKQVGGGEGLELIREGGIIDLALRTQKTRRGSNRDIFKGGKETKEKD